MQAYLAAHSLQLQRRVSRDLPPKPAGLVHWQMCHALVAGGAHCETRNPPLPLPVCGRFKPYALYAELRHCWCVVEYLS